MVGIGRDEPRNATRPAGRPGPAPPRAEPARCTGARRATARGHRAPRETAPAPYQGETRPSVTAAMDRYALGAMTRLPNASRCSKCSSVSATHRSAHAPGVDSGSGMCRGRTGDAYVDHPRSPRPRSRRRDAAVPGNLSRTVRRSSTAFAPTTSFRGRQEDPRSGRRSSTWPFRCSRPPSQAGLGVGRSSCAASRHQWARRPSPSLLMKSSSSHRAMRATSARPFTGPRCTSRHSRRFTRGYRAGVEACWKPPRSLPDHPAVAASDEKPGFAGQIMPRS